MSNLEKQGIIVGISGGGSTMQAVYEATQSGRLSRTKIVGVFVTDPESSGIDKARKFKTLNPKKDVVVIDPSDGKYGERIVDFFEARKDRFDVFCQYGLTPFTPGIVIDWLEQNGKLGINQHGGAVNPDKYDFGGKGMSCPEIFHAARLMFVRETMRNYKQWVVSQRLGRDYDSGKVLKRRSVPIYSSDRVEDLKQRCIDEEHHVQIETLLTSESKNLHDMPPIENLVLESERAVLSLAKGIAVRLYDKHGAEILNPDFSELIENKNVETMHQIRRMVGSLYPRRFIGSN